jgi:hypothetical protein
MIFRCGVTATAATITHRNNGVSFHMYAVKANLERRQKVPLFWEIVETYRGADLQGMNRLNSLIGLIDYVYPLDQWPQEDKELYGLRQLRDTAKFFKTYGIHTDNSTLEPHLCKFGFVGKSMIARLLTCAAGESHGTGLEQD